MPNHAKCLRDQGFRVRQRIAEPDGCRATKGVTSRLVISSDNTWRLQVVAAGFVENHVATGSQVRTLRNAEDLANGYLDAADTVGRRNVTGATVQRQAVLELDVLNRTEMALQVPKPLPTFCFPSV
jgi:hypothetical protein